MKKHNKILSLLLKIFIIFISIGIAFILFIMGVYFRYSRDLPSVDNIPNPIQSSKIYCDEQTLIAEIYTQRRTLIQPEEIPKIMINALISIEDKRFYSHKGIDPLAIIRAFLRNIREGKTVEGASTITMQTARNIFLTRFKSLDRKIKEAILALRLENHYTKEEILTIYLNNIYFGRGVYGIYEASKSYFGKELSELTLEECALIASLPKAPYTYNPFRNPDLALNRRNIVLYRMHDLGYINDAEYKNALNEPLNLASERRQAFGSYFIDFIRANLISLVGEKSLFEGGLIINTTINLETQKIAEESMRRGLVIYQRKRPFQKETVLFTEEVSFIKRYPEYNIAIIKEVQRNRLEVSLKEDKNDSFFIDINNSGFTDIKDFTRYFEKDEKILITPNESNESYMLIPVPRAQGALIALDLEDNSIKAMVGGFSYNDSQFNRSTQARRQPGSAFKPFVFLTALLYGYTPVHTTYDLPLLVTEYKSRTQSRFEEGWKPSNFDGRYLGNISFANAMFQSRNTIAVRLAQETTTMPIKYLAVLSGISSFIPVHLSMSLGSASMSLLEICHAYSVFPNQGRQIPLKFIEEIYDSDYQRQNFHTSFEKNVILPQYAYQMVRILNGVIEKGTGRYAKRLKMDIAGKTGTSNNFRDNWFIGFTPDLLVGVWIGMDDFSSLGRNHTGGNTACPIWTDFIDSLELPGNSYFKAPRGMITYPLSSEEQLDCNINPYSTFQAFWQDHFFIELFSDFDKREDILNF